MKTIFSLLFLILSFSAFSTVKIEEEAYIVGARPEVLKELIDVGSVEIDHVTSAGFEVYGRHGLHQYLTRKKLPFLDLRDINQKAFNGYPTFAEMTQKLKSIVAKRPGIMKIFSIGSSVKGKELWVVKISDNVESDEVEPEFKYISSMHGDEITGRELTVRLIEEIGEKYGTDSEITELVNNTEIFIMPSMNPDGSEMMRRANAKGTDLNRNFPDILTDRENSSKGREVETRAVMKFQKERQFSFSANFHGGTIVMNYPWDSKYDLHPLDDLVKELAMGYSELNPEMISSTEFQGGITNGAAWYVVRGGMQDWSYLWHNDLQITVELSHTKWPNYSEIPSFYKSNRDSMIYYMKQIHQGVGFKVMRKNISGNVAIKQVSPVTRNLGSFTFSNSEFYKVLPEGEYMLTINEKISMRAFMVNARVQKGEVARNGNYLSLP